MIVWTCRFVLLILKTRVFNMRGQRPGLHTTR